MDWVGNATVKREFDGFTAEVSGLLLRTGYLMTGDAKDAEDLAQETLLRVAQRWNRVRSMEHPAAYARRILITLVLHDNGRRSRQRAELRSRDGAFDASDEAAARALRQVEDVAEFRWALAQLPARQRAVLVLRYWADLPVAEVADVLGCSAGTVTSTASRAAGRLAGALAHGDPAATGRPHDPASLKGPSNAHPRP
ncbi:MAG: SigE family RNA polymerase sigma factor [Streptosporangiaceae bacterium]